MSAAAVAAAAATILIVAAKLSYVCELVFLILSDRLRARWHVHGARKGAGDGFVQTRSLQEVEEKCDLELLFFSVSLSAIFFFRR